MKTALITGITGQDAAYLAKILLEKDYKVFGAGRRSSSKNLWRLSELNIAKNVELVDFDLTEYNNITNTIAKIKPDEIYNLAAQSFVTTSFEQPIYTSEVDALGPLRILESIRILSRDIKFYQASTSEMFGLVKETPQTESTPFHPRSPYGVAKLYGHWITINYRESYSIFACSGILFNHESPLRGQEFVSRKITLTLARIANGSAETLQLGNMEAQRDWGFAGDYVEGMWRILQAGKPSDYVLATGKTHTVRAFVDTAAKCLGFDLMWEGQGINQKAIDRISNKLVVEINPKYFRLAEVDILLGNHEKATKDLNWRPLTSFETLVDMMCKRDYDRVKTNNIFG